MMTSLDTNLTNKNLYLHNITLDDVLAFFGLWTRGSEGRCRHASKMEAADQRRFEGLRYPTYHPSLTESVST